MARRSSDISLLLLILILFSASIGFLHGSKMGPQEADIPERSEVLSVEDALDTMQTVLLSGNMDQAAQLLIRPTTPQEALDVVLQGKAVIPLSDMQQILLLIAAIAYQTEEEQDMRYFDKLAKLFPDEPIFIYAYDRYAPFLQEITQWAEKNKKMSLLQNWKMSSFLAAIEANNEPLLRWLYAHNVRPSAKEATTLLDQVVAGNKDVSFVPLLVRQLKANPDYSADGKMSVLMKAAANGNYRMVRALVEVGADSDLILDNQTGSAIQVAYENGYPLIERFLRQQK
jgi:hypothetical protein